MERLSVPTGQSRQDPRVRAEDRRASRARRQGLSRMASNSVRIEERTSVTYDLVDLVAIP
jgi:hypothetical protein